MVDTNGISCATADPAAGAAGTTGEGFSGRTITLGGGFRRARSQYAA